MNNHKLGYYRNKSHLRQIHYDAKGDNKHLSSIGPHHVPISAGLEICVTSELSLYSKLGKAKPRQE